MQPYLNALLLKFDGEGEEKKDAPTKSQVAVTWATVSAVVMLLVR